MNDFWHLFTDDVFIARNYSPRIWMQKIVGYARL